eukprot:s1763_g5.t1
MESTKPSSSKDIPLFALAFVLMSTFCACFLGKTNSWTQSRRLLGVAEFYLVIFGCIAGYGAAMLVGVPFTVLHQILPFILVGIGIDDAFVICGAFDGTPKTMSYPDRIELAVQRVGVSITLTKLTSLASFLLGATCVFPAVQWFCYYAASSCFFIWLLHLSAFPALLALDAKRAGASPPRLDPCACMAARSSCMPGVLPVLDASGEKQETAPEESKLGKALCMMIRFLTSHVAGIVITILLFLAVAGISAWQVSNGLGTDFDIMDLTPDQSFLRDFYNKEQEHFGGLSTGGLALPTNYYIRDVNFSTVEVQRSMEQVGAEMLALKSINSERGLKSWHTFFTLWANQYKGTSASLPLEAFVAVDVDREGCAAGLPNGVTTCATHFLTGPTFPNAVLEFLYTSMGAQFDGDIHWEGNDISVLAPAPVQQQFVLELREPQEAKEKEPLQAPEKMRSYPAAHAAPAAGRCWAIEVRSDGLVADSCSTMPCRQRLVMLWWCRVYLHVKDSTVAGVVAGGSSGAKAAAWGRVEQASRETYQVRLSGGLRVQVLASNLSPAEARLEQWESRYSYFPSNSRMISQTSQETFYGKHYKVGEPEKLTPEVCVFSGCNVTNGKGRGVVTATGMGTRIGRIAQLIAGEEGPKKKCYCLPDTSANQTPLQRT